MSRYRDDDLAYGDSHNRWDRDRFDRSSRAPPQPPEPPRRFEEDIRITERERRGGTQVAFQERTSSRGPRSHDDRDRIFRETYGGRRRSDRELFGDVDPRDIADMAVAPYKGGDKGNNEKDLEITIRESRGRNSRPSLARRQSSLDTYDRRPQPRYDRDESRLPAYTPIPLPIRRRDTPEETYREVEVKRERSVHRRSGKKSRVSSRSSSSSSSISTIVDRRPSSPPRPGFKKGKTRMPKRLVYREAIIDCGYPFIEEDRFYILQVALEKEQIDEVIKISESYKASGKHDVFRYEERIEDTSEGAHRHHSPNHVEREEIIRKEYINPPSDFLRVEEPKRSRSSRRARSPSISSSISQRHSRSRARSTVLPGPEFFEQRTKTVVQETSPSDALVTQRHEHRSDMEIQAEILRLEAERKYLRIERGDDMQLALVREERPTSDIIIRDRSPPRNVVRVEKDRKEERRQKRNARVVAAAIATLT